MNTNQDIKAVQIFAGSIFQAGMVKGLLENSGIKAYLKDENLGTFAPWWAAGGGAGAVKIIISNQDVDRARIVVDDYYKNLKDN